MTEIYAHRGLHKDERENSVASFLRARELGVDGVELDVRRTSDGALVVHHDPLVDGHVIAQTRQRDLPGHVATLEEVMTACEGLRVNVEIKNLRDVAEPTYDATGDFAREVVAQLHAMKWADRVVISCFDQVTCCVVRSFDSSMPVGWLLWDVELHSALTKAHVWELNAVHPYFEFVSPSTMSLARELGLEVNVWTVNAREDIGAMAALGVDCIITDDPALAMEVVAKGS